MVGETSIAPHPDVASTNASEADTLLDIREVDGEPFDDIVAALDGLANGETLRLVAPFEPEPPYGVLEGRGFAHDTAHVDGEYHVDIRHA